MKKPLLTREQIDAAYPIHAQYKQLQQQIEGAQKLLEHLKAQGVKLCREVDPEHWEGQEYGPAFDFQGSCDPGGVPTPKVFAALGLDYDGFMREKDDMLEQFRLHQEDPS